MITSVLLYLIMVIPEGLGLRTIQQYSHSIRGRFDRKLNTLAAKRIAGEGRVSNSHPRFATHAVI
jgi:hypothetical protein